MLGRTGCRLVSSIAAQRRITLIDHPAERASSPKETRMDQLGPGRFRQERDQQPTLRCTTELLAQASSPAGSCVPHSERLSS